MKKIIRVLAVAMLVLVVLSGCNQNAEPAPDSNKNPTPSTNPEVTNPKPDPVDPEPIATTLSVLMSREDIINTLGEDYTLDTQPDGFAFNYSTTLTYDGIIFIYGHDEEEIPEEAHLSEIRITSNDYKLNYDFSIGDLALDAITECEEKLENLFDHHNEKDRFDVFKYKEKNSDGSLVETSLVITWEYDADEAHYSSIDELPEGVKIRTIRLFEPWD